MTHLNTLRQGFWIKRGRAESSSSFESAPRPHSIGTQAISKRRKRETQIGTQADWMWHPGHFHQIRKQTSMLAQIEKITLRLLVVTTQTQLSASYGAPTFQRLSRDALLVRNNFIGTQAVNRMAPRPCIELLTLP